ncbi:MAG: metal-dependent hydrolase [Gammaproteobacteria bacterium]|nr:metal-dependent hydrolase [Gammaproteobacteria bacterium]
MIHRNRLVGGLLASLALFGASVGQAQAFELQWFGQAAFKLTTESGKVIVIDPFLLKNPKTPAELKNLEQLGKVDLILVTHGHFDHTADVPALAAMTGAKVGMNADMGSVYSSLDIVPKDQLVRWNKSGTVMPIGDDIKITMVRAEHSSTVTHDGHVHAGGEPVGYIIELENGYKIYHSGDTGVFGDMKMIGDYYKPDLALICIGGWFTMGPVEAAYAMNELMRPKMVVPMHYGTFPPLKGTPEEFIKALGKSPVEVKVMTPGETLTL